MKHLSDFLMAVLAGIAISIGGTVFLSLDDKVLGATFFAVGLFMVCTLGLNLFTGKVCYLPAQEKKGPYLVFLGIVWLGNLVGTELTALAVQATRIGAALQAKAQGLADTKAGDSLISLFVLGIFCNILIFVAVESYKSNQTPVGKYLGLFFGVTVFILAGFEHCVADMFYFAVANAWSPRTLLCLVAITLGNSVGGMLLPLCFRLRDKVQAG